jgi:hypothetical protein
VLKIVLLIFVPPSGKLLAEVQKMQKKKPMSSRDLSPDVHQFPGVPQDCFDLVNQYGTYNIQPTVDTENTFPLIGQGLPKKWSHLALGKQDLEDKS